jgi:hypothetical protein
MTEKEKIIMLFDMNVRGKNPNTDTFHQGHDGKYGHWLEEKMGIKANANNAPDLFGYEMKNDTSSKTSFGDWSASYYIYKKNSGFGINRSDFLNIFGKPNPKKEGRYSWSGEPCPKIGKFNNFGQILSVDTQNNISALYFFSKDKRENKVNIVPKNMQIEGLVLAKWNAEKLKKNLEKKFNQSGWFKCIRNNKGIYTSIAFGNPINFDNWINFVRAGYVFFDSGMYDGNKRSYSHWRAHNSFWDKLIITTH